jgi:hypothetical protein
VRIGRAPITTAKIAATKRANLTAQGVRAGLEVVAQLAKDVVALEERGHPVSHEGELLADELERRCHGSPHIEGGPGGAPAEVTAG